MQLENGNAGGVLDMFYKGGFNVVALKYLQLTKAQAQQFYAVHKERPFFWRFSRIYDIRTNIRCYFRKR